MFFIVYKTINLSNGKFYIGVHKSTNIEDNYLGSGKLLKRAIKKHGIESFKREIIHCFDNAKEAYQLEKELLSKEVIASKECYNIKEGREGRFDYINISGKNTQRNMENNKNGGLATYAKYGKIINQEKSNMGWKTSKRFLGKKHSLETRRKISFSKKGKKLGEENSQFGTFWINDGHVSRKWKGDLPPGWVKGRLRMHVT